MRVFLCFLIATAALSGADVLKLDKLPLVFEPNRGQVDSQVRFLARGGGFTLFLTDHEAVMSMKGAEPVRMSLVGGTKPKEFERLEPTGGISNYFIGNDPSKWRTEVPQYRRVKYRGVYPGVDLVYYGDGGKLEYDLLVAPGANASRIEIAYQGVESIRVDKQGDLLLKTTSGELRQQRPKVYQQDNGQRIEVEARYRLHRGNVVFELARYDRAKPLVIDPVFVYSTYLGGGHDDVGNGIAVDGNGNAYVTGMTASVDFPTAGAPQGSRSSYDVFVTKFNPSGSALIYSTFLGGSALDEGQSIAVDASGNAYVTGATSSTDFPTVSPFQNTFGGGGSDAFVAKINASGSALMYSTYLGGTGYDGGYGIAVDASGNAYVTGQAGSSDFPTTNPFQATYGGGGDAFVTKINASGSAKVYCSFLGGSLVDAGYGIAVDSSGNAYVTGYTYSNPGFSDFPTTNPIQGASAGLDDAFVTKINASGSAKVYSTYLGGSGVDFGQGIAVDSSGNAYVTGYTRSTDFPTANPFQGTLGNSQNAYQNVFVTKLNASGSAKVYSTYLGGSGGDNGQGIAVDASGNAYVTGSTTSTDFPGASPVHSTYVGTQFAFVTKMNASGSAEVYSIYLGGSVGAAGFGIAVDATGKAYVTGDTTSTDFPTANPFQSTNNGANDVFVSVISASASTTVPNVVGLSQAAAATSITNAGLVLGTVSMAASGTVPAGSVISESPVAGTSVSGGSAVNLVVSSGNAPPPGPILSLPSNAASGVSLTPTLNWNASAGATSYSIYFGTETAPPLVNGTAGTSFTPGTLVAGQTYYWQIVAMNSGGTGASSVWSFTTSNAASVMPTSVSPGSGNTSTQTFSFTFTDPNGFSDLSVLDVLINNYLDGISACYFALAPASASSGYLYLLDDGGLGSYVSGSPMFLPSSGSLTNSQCTLNGAGSSISASGNTLVLTLSITFKAAFAGNRIFYMAARSNTQNSGWQALGTWNVPGSSPTGPAVSGMSPGRSTTLGQTYTFTFTDTGGYADLNVLDILTNSFLDGISACYVAYVPTGPTTGYLYLVDDYGSGGYAPGSPMLLSSGGTLQNSQCTINTAGSSASASGNNLNLNLAITFKAAFAGNQVFYLAGRNNTTGNSGWQAVGSVTIP